MSDVNNNKIEVIQAIERLRRAMARNPDVLLVCAAAEAQLAPAVQAMTDDKVKMAYNIYMRQAMRKHRAKKRLPASGPVEPGNSVGKGRETDQS